MSKLEYRRAAPLAGLVIQRGRVDWLRFTPSRQ